MREANEGSAVQDRVRQYQRQVEAEQSATIGNKAEEAEGSLVKTDALESMAKIFRTYFEQYGDRVSVEVTSAGINIAISAAPVTKALSKAISEQISKGTSRLTLPTLRYTQLNIIGCFNLAQMLDIEVPPDLQRLKEAAQDPRFVEQLRLAGAKAEQADEALSQARTREMLAEEAIAHARAKEERAERAIDQARSRELQAEEALVRADSMTQLAQATMAEAEIKEERVKIALAEIERKIKLAEEMQVTAELKTQQADAVVDSTTKLVEAARVEAKSMVDQVKAELAQAQLREKALEHKLKQVTEQQTAMSQKDLSKEQAMVAPGVDITRVQKSAAEFFNRYGDNLSFSSNLIPRMEWKYGKDISFNCEMLIVAFQQNYTICNDRYFFSGAFDYFKKHATFEQMQRLLKAFINNKEAFRLSFSSYNCDIVAFLESKSGVERNIREQLIEAILSDAETVKNLFEFAGSNPHEQCWKNFLHLVEETRGNSNLLDYLTSPHAHYTFKFITPDTLGLLLQRFGAQNRSRLLNFYLECFKGEYVCKRTLCESSQNLLGFVDKLVLREERVKLLRVLDDYPVAWHQGVGVILLEKDKPRVARANLCKIDPGQNTLQPITDENALADAEKEIAKWFDVALRRNAAAYEEKYPSWQYSRNRW